MTNKTCSVTYLSDSLLKHALSGAFIHRHTGAFGPGGGDLVACPKKKMAWVESRINRQTKWTTKRALKYLLLLL